MSNHSTIIIIKIKQEPIAHTRQLIHTQRLRRPCVYLQSFHLSPSLSLFVCLVPCSHCSHRTTFSESKRAMITVTTIHFIVLLILDMYYGDWRLL
jgi:hypothetical protein